MGVLGPSTNVPGDTEEQYLRQGATEENVGHGPPSLYTMSHRAEFSRIACIWFPLLAGKQLGIMTSPNKYH